MSQHDFNIANADGATVRADINNALGAAVTCSSGATAPTTTFAYQWWADTGTDTLKQRNAANSAWISILTLSTGAPADADIPTVSASQAEMEAGTEAALRSMSPLRVKQAITANASTPTVASTAEAQAGTNNTNMITPLRMREGFNASGSAPVYACRAWVNFNGTGTVAIRASGNVSSVTDNGTGDYTVNFTTALPDADYAVVGAGGQWRSTGMMGTLVKYGTTPTTSAVTIQTTAYNESLQDSPIVTISIFR